MPHAVTPNLSKMYWLTSAMTSSASFPGDRRELAANPHLRLAQAILCQSIGRIDFLGQTTTANRVIAVDIDDRRVGIGDDRNVMFLSTDDALAVSIGTDPLSGQLLGRKINTQGVFFGPDTALGPCGPSVDLVTATNDAVVASGRHHVGVLRRQRDSGRRFILLRHHAVSELGFWL